jgi:hypothetical protein
MHCTVLSGNEETAIRLGAALILGGTARLGPRIARETSRLANLRPGQPRGGRRDDRCARIPEPSFGN